MSLMPTDCDVLIIGGGLAGTSLGCALARSRLRCMLVEAAPFKTGGQPSYDDRAIALAYGSRRIFEGMGLWEELQTQVTPIRSIHVSDRGHFGVTRLDCRDEGLDALGYIIPARELGLALTRASTATPGLEIISPARLASLEFSADGARAGITVDGATREIRARLVVAADGGQSTVRELVGIRHSQRDYEQTAVFANVTPELPHDNIAHERFSATGPLALLPMAEGRCGLVWTQCKEQVEAVMALNDTEFLAQLGEAFGYRLGRFVKVGKRHAYPLELGWTREAVRERLVLIGNAAHTLHPIAGQGFNLGLRDVAALAQTLADAHNARQDIGALALLRDYQRWRRFDQGGALVFTHGLARVFSTAWPPLAGARNAGMIVTDLLPPLKHVLIRNAMGLAGRLPRLARGLPL
jgi:2-octaprenyl-6-methoxyphenol hydroxylase